MLRGPMNELVLSYLMHHGYAETAKALKADFEARESRNRTTEAMDTDGALPATRTTFDGVGPGMHEPEIQVRTRIVQAVARGDVDTALRETRERHPLVLERNGGLMLIKLRCRKFVEMIIEAADLLKQAQRASDGVGKGVLSHDVEDGVVGAMDVDEDSAPAFTTPMSKGKAVFRNTPRQDYETALTDAIVYGKSLRADFQVDARQEVQDLLTETFCIVAYEDPRDVPGEPTRVAGQEARNALASEINQAILGKSSDVLLSKQHLIYYNRNTGPTGTTRSRTSVPSGICVYSPARIDGCWRCCLCRYP
jgi:Ran-binding protein 9/10